jgi:hypothetical protein
LLLRARLWRMPAQLMQRWLSFHVDFHTLVNVSTGGRGAYPFPRTPGGARQTQFSPVRSLLQRHGLQATHPRMEFSSLLLQPHGLQATQQARQAEMPTRRLEFRRAAPLPAMAAVHRAATLASIADFPGERRTSIFGGHVPLRYDADRTPVSRLLARRLRRVSEESPNRVPMALRRDSAPPATSRLPPVEVLAERRLFEQQVRRIGDATAATPAVNVEQLASQVLQHIDRRVIARRERMGQV